MGLRDGGSRHCSSCDGGTAGEESNATHKRLLAEDVLILRPPGPLADRASMLGSVDGECAAVKFQLQGMPSVSLFVCALPL